MVLAEAKVNCTRKRILLTGDGRGDQLIKGLEKSKLLNSEGGATGGYS